MFKPTSRAVNTGKYKTYETLTYSLGLILIGGLIRLLSVIMVEVITRI